ncbi:MAG TPA: hypothetical protein ENK07_10960 [Bacteroidetes bacterium]|nr:hypothetical protein [Bacteroidota bacterium]
MKIKAKAHFFLASWLTTRLVVGLELSRLALVRGRPLARIIRIFRQRRELPEAFWTADKTGVSYIGLDRSAGDLHILKFPFPSSN